MTSTETDGELVDHGVFAQSKSQLSCVDIVIVPAAASENNPCFCLRRVGIICSQLFAEHFQTHLLCEALLIQSQEQVNRLAFSTALLQSKALSAVLLLPEQMSG